MSSTANDGKNAGGTEKGKRQKNKKQVAGDGDNDLNVTRNSESAADSDHDLDDKILDGDRISPAYMNPLVRRAYLLQLTKESPEPVQNRLVALKNLQVAHLKIESKFFEEVYALEKRYQDKFQKLMDERAEIINGDVEPPEKTEPIYKETSEMSEDEEQDDEDKEELNFNKRIKDYSEVCNNAKGIPHFWLMVFKNTEIMAELIKDYDEDALKYLIDLKIKYDDDLSYTLEFHFAENEFFTDKVLTKQYFLRTEVDEDFPFGFEGPEIVKCKGCEINWKPKMNLTIKTISKKQKHKTTGAVRRVFKQIANETFFNFFSPPVINEQPDFLDQEVESVLATDYEIGHFLRTRVIPKAVLYFTGDIIDDEDDDCNDDCDDDGDDDSDDDDEDDDDDDDDGGRVIAAVAADDNKQKKVNDCPNQ